MTQRDRHSAGDIHLTDGALVALLDAPADSESAQLHVDRCDACGQRLELYRRRSVALHDIFAQHAHEAPASHSRGARTIRPLRRMALAQAALLLLAVGVVAAAPIVLRYMTGLAADSPKGSELSPAVPPVATGPIVEFDAMGAVFSIVYSQPPAGATLLLVSRDRREASAQVTRLDADESLVVLPTGLGISSARPSAANVRIELPSSVREVRVMGAGREGEQRVPIARLDSVTLSFPARR